MKIPSRHTSLFASTALAGAAMCMLMPEMAYAACSSSAPASSQTVLCSGTHTTSINAPASDSVTITLDPAATITTAGNSILLGNGIINMGAGSSITSTGGQAITMGSFAGGPSIVNIAEGAAVTGGIFLDNSAIQTVSIRGTVDNVTLGDNTPFVQTLTLYSTGSITGTATAAASVAPNNQTFILGGTTLDGVFNSDLIGTRILNFDTFRKIDSGTWTLTGTTAQNWQVFSGTLVATTANIGNVSNSNSVRIDQASMGTYAGIISGIGSVTIQGGGTVTFSNTNTYTGGTTIDGATLRVGADSNLGGAGTITMANGGTLSMSTAFNSARAFNLTGGDAIISTPSLSSTTTLSGIISGAGRLVKAGAGLLILSNNANSFNGLKVDGTDSIVRVNNDARMGNASGVIELSNGGALQLNGAITTNRNIFLSGGDGIVTNLGMSTILNGTISGSGRFVRNGNALMTLGGNNTYTGGTYIGPISSLQIMSDSALGDASGDVEMNTGFLLFGSSFTTARDFTTNVYTGGIGGFFDTQTFDNTISGNLLGVGKIYKSGSGTLTLTGTNSNPDGFEIQAGTLKGDTDNLRGDITNAATLNFDQSANGTYTGIISGSGSFIKEGAGNLILSNTHTYTGTTTVNAGRLAVNGSIASSAVTVNAGGNLGGSGTIGTLAMNGRLTPGNSIGTLHAGNTTFNTGSIYEVEIDDGLNSDLLDITGTLDINAGASVSVLSAPGTYADGSLYTIITHSGARTGTFTSITDNLAFLTASLIYNPNDVQVLLTSNSVPFSNVGKDLVQYDTAEALEDLGAGNSLYDAFIGLTVNDAQNALDTLSGEHIPGVTGAMAQTTGIIRNALGTRMQAITYNRGGALSAALAPAAGSDGGMFSEYTASFVEPAAGNAQLRDGSSRIWMEAFGTAGKSVAEGTASRQDRGSAGLLAGADAELDSGTYIGIFGGFEQGEVNTYSERASSAITNYHGGLYAVHQFDPIRLSGGVGGTYHMIETTRYVVFPGFSEKPESDTNGYTATAFIEASHPFEMAGNWATEPFAGVSVTYSHMDGYAEQGGGAANLTVDDTNAFTPSQILGVRFGNTLETEEGSSYHLSGSLGWQHSYGDLEDKASMRFSAGTTKFTTMGPGRVRDAAVVGMGIDAKFGDGMSAYGGYNGTLSPDAQDHALNGGIRLSF